MGLQDFLPAAVIHRKLTPIVERAFLEGQIDGVKAELAYLLIAPRADAQTQ